MVHPDTAPYLQAPVDPMDENGYVSVSEGHGLGVELDWDYISRQSATE